MTDYEICAMYRESKHKSTQLQILAELNDTNRNEILRILLDGGEKLPSSEAHRLYKKLDRLNANIRAKEKELYKKEQEYLQIVKLLRIMGGVRNGKNS